MLTGICSFSDEKAFKPESLKDKKETGKPTGASSKEREAETAREKLKEVSKAGVKPETGRKDDKEAKTKPDTFKDAELKPTKLGDKVMQEEQGKLEKPGIKKEAAREDGTTKPTKVTAKETVTLPKAEDQRTVSDIKKTRADLADSQKDKVPKEFKDTKKTEGDLKAREDEKMMGKPAKEIAPTPGKTLEKVEEDGKSKDAKKETKDLAKYGKEPITERVKKYEEKMAGREKTRPEDQLVKPQKDSEIQPAKKPESRGLADEKAKTQEEDSKKKEKDILKSAKRADEDEILKDRGKPTGKIGEVSPGVTDDKAKQAFKEKDKSIITKPVDKGDIAKDRPAGKIEEIPAAERGRESPSAADGKSKQAAKEKPLGDKVTTKAAEDKDQEDRKRVAREALPDTKQPDGDVKAKAEKLTKPVKGTEALAAAKKAEEVMDVQPIKPLVTKPGKGIGEDDVAGAEKAFKELTASTAQADAIKRQKDEMAEERKKLEKVPKTGADILKERKKEGEFSIEFCHKFG